jgi:hypothetical protein
MCIWNDYATDARTVAKYVPLVRALAKEGLNKSSIQRRFGLSRTSEGDFSPDPYQVIAESQCRIIRTRPALSVKDTAFPSLGR